MRLGLGLGLNNRRRPARISATTLVELSHELVLPIELLDVVESISEGRVIRALIDPWQSIFDQLQKNPNLLFQFSKNHREFEEFIAGAYERAGFEQVILTPASGDLGRDVIAEKQGFGTVRVIDQCKAFSKGNLVTANDVRAMMGTFFREGSASKAVVTTTSDFAPGISKEWQDHLGQSLELRNGEGLLKWMNSFDETNKL